MFLPALTSMISTARIGAGQGSDFAAILNEGQSSASLRYRATTVPLRSRRDLKIQASDSNRLIFTVFDVDGFMWVRSRVDTLMFGTSGRYGKAGLWVWTPNRGVLPVVLSNNPAVERFELRSVIPTPDGKLLINYKRGTWPQTEFRFEHGADLQIKV